MLLGEIYRRLMSVHLHEHIVVGIVSRLVLKAEIDKRLDAFVHCYDVTPLSALLHLRISARIAHLDRFLTHNSHISHLSEHEVSG